jgi:hypothetical protein
MAETTLPGKDYNKYNGADGETDGGQETQEGRKVVRIVSSRAGNGDSTRRDRSVVL